MKFRVMAFVTISADVVVEADTEEEARSLADALPLPTLCFMCAEKGNDPEDECWRVDSLDGEPEIQWVIEDE